MRQDALGVSMYLIIDHDEHGNPVPELSDCFPLATDNDVLDVYFIDGMKLMPIRSMGKYKAGVVTSVHCPCDCARSAL